MRYVILGLALLIGAYYASTGPVAIPNGGGDPCPPKTICHGNG